MAVVHRSKNTLALKMNLYRLALILCVLLMIAVAGLVGYAYVRDHGRLLELGSEWRAAYTTAVVDWWKQQELGSDAWMEGLHAAGTVWLTGAETAVRFAPMLLPAVIGIFLLALLLRLAYAAHGGFRRIKAGVDGERSALKLARKLPKSCHVFVNKHICFDGGRSETDLILVGPGGVAVVEVKNLSGRISGQAGDKELTRVKGHQKPEMIRNPAKQVAVHVRRLGKYLRAEGLEVWVVPCVAFVNSRASIAITGTAPEFFQDVKGTVMVTAQEFSVRIGRPIEQGEVYDSALVGKIAEAIRKAPEK